jgi:hypothetical protein
LIGLRWPLAAYVVASLVLLYPIYTISIYLAILFLAISILFHRPASHYLGATVLVLATPLLAKYQLHWVIPILAGLWWGSINGFWIAVLAGFWGKLAAGMGGLDLDWLTLAGQSPTVAAILQRCTGLGPLPTLGKLFQPFAIDTTILLYHLLQVAVWAMVAGLIGFLAGQKWLYHRFPWSTLLITALGIVSVGGGYILLAVWLRGLDPAVFDYEPLLIGAVLGLVIASTLEVFRQTLELPVAPKLHKRVITVPVTRSSTGQDGTTTTVGRTQSQPTPIPLPDLPEWQPPEEDNNDLILLELD